MYATLTSREHGFRKSISLLLCAAMLLTLFLPFAVFKAASDPAPVAPYLDVTLSAEERAADLVSRMTRTEKQSQLKAQAPAIPRLGLKQYMYQNEALHGMAKDGATSFSSPIGMASSWNPELMKGVGDIISDEIRAYYNSRNNEGLSYWSPTINLQRDPRWGRNEESYSEDPFLTTVMGEMFVRGMQEGAAPQLNPNRPGEYYLKTIPTLKHYAANNSEGNREDGSSNVDNKLLRDYYTRAFQRITERTNVASLMTAYNAVNGVPAATNDYLNNTLLRKVFGFTGYTVGDCGALTFLVEKQKYVDNYPEAVALGLTGGTDQDCGGGTQNWIYDKYALSAVEQGYMTEDDMDRALVRILALRFRTGEFDGGAYKDYTMTNTAESQANRDHALLTAQQAAILLENKNNTLPIQLDAVSNINVYGPLIDRTDLGDYSGRPTKDMQNFRNGFTSYLDGKAFATSDDLAMYQGMSPTVVNDTQNMVNVRWIGFGPTQIKHAARDAKDSQGVSFENANRDNLNNVGDGSWVKYEGIDLSRLDREIRVWSGSVRDYSTQAVFHLDGLEGPVLGVVTMPSNYRVNADGGRDWHPYPGNANPPSGFQSVTASNWYSAGFSTNPPALGTVRMTANGGTPTAANDIDYAAATAGSYFDAAILDQQMANGSVRDIYVEFLYRRDNQIKTAEIEAAETGKDANSVAVVYVGTSSGFSGAGVNASANWGAFKVCSEHSDRKNLQLPANQDALIDKVVTEAKKHNGKVIVVIQSVGCVDVSAFKDKVDAILWTPYNGQRQAEALSSLLVGDYNPGGHTTQTWYKDDTQLTDNTTGFYENYALVPGETGGKGRTYMYMTGTPQYPFGYGLSYTDFTIANVRADKTSVAANGTVTVTADVTNNGGVKGAEVVQVYVKAPGAGTGLVPKKQLCGFARVELAAGQTKTVTVEIDVTDFSAIDETTVGDFTVDRGGIDPQDVDFNTVSGGGHGKRVVKPGSYTLEVAYDSATTAQSLNLTVTGGLEDGIKLVTLAYSKTTMMIGQSVAAPMLSVCKTDETFLTQGVQVTYTSSSPAVTVNAATGAIQAVRGGTAVITATVTYNGKTYTGTAPVAVASFPYVSDIRIDGVSLDGFTINKDRYEVAIPLSQPQKPVITFDNPDPANISVDLRMPEKINGRAVLTVSKAGEKDMVYMIDMHYPPDEGYNVSVGTIRKESGMVARLDDKDFYIDWSAGEIIPAEDGGDRVNLLAPGVNRENLYLTFTLTVEGDREHFPHLLTNIWDGSSINFRSSDRTGFGEGRFGWSISNEWNLQYGDNYIRIPLAHALAKPDSYYINGDKNADVDTYQVEVNGEKVRFSSSILTRERIRGWINFADVKQVLLHLAPNSVTAADMAGFSAVISDFKFVDETANNIVAEKRAVLSALTETKLPAAPYTPASYKKYTDAIDAAKEVLTFADAIGPFDYYIELVTKRTAELVLLADEVKVTGVSLNSGTLSLEPGQTVKLTATVAPGDASNQDVVWASDREAVATVDPDGNVTAVAPGTAVITVTTDDGGKTAACTVTVRGAADILLGDVSGDGGVDSTDARMVLQYEVTLIELDAAQQLAADVNEDDKIDSTDARMILQYEVTLIDKFPAEA